MSKAFLFPGQASQYVGMGQILNDKNQEFKNLFARANELMNYDLAQIMFQGPDEALKETINTQPAVFLHSYMVWKDQNSPIDEISAVAGHSLGEITALVVAGVLSFEGGFLLVKHRAEAMQKACEQNPSTMAAILGMEDEIVESICNSISGIVVPANYNCPGQLVISGSYEAIAEAITKCKEAGARRALEISVGGAFHSPLMEPAMSAFKEAVEKVTFSDATIPVYQNVDAKAHTDATMIKQNLIKQIISPVRWTETIENMISDGINSYIEVGGKGKILLGMLRKISRQVEANVWLENE